MSLIYFRCDIILYSLQNHSQNKIKIKQQQIKLW